MTFPQQTITIRDINAGTRQVTAWIGEGTGLAYLQTLDTDGNLMKDTYNLMHILSGYALPHHVSTEAEAQTFLEKVACIFPDRWNCDLRTITKRLRRNQSHIMSQIELAHYDSLAPFVDFFLYAASKDEIYTESHTDAYDKDPKDAGNFKIAQRLLSEYPEATQVVMVRMADADGIHQELHTFERTAMALTASTEE
jgi:hypothetical protein